MLAQPEQVAWQSVAWENGIVSLYVHNILKATKIARAFDAQFIAFFQPTVFFKTTLSKEEQKFMNNPLKDRIIQMRKKIRFQFAQEQKESEFLMIDLSDIFAHTKTWVFTDEVHTHQSSKPMIAQEMFYHICNMIEME